MVQRRSGSRLSVSASALAANAGAEKAIKRFSKRTAEALLNASTQLDLDHQGEHADTDDDRDDTSVAADADAVDNADEGDAVLTTDTKQFLDALQRDPLRKCIMRPFELPFSKSEIKNLEARKVEHRPPHYGKINKCVFVSKPAPNAELPVHKCNCFAETKVVSTKRETQIASTKLLKENGGKRRLRTPIKSGGEKADEHEKPVALLCGENCHNRMLFISCSDDTCSAPDPSMCSNRAIKRREVKSMRVDYIPGPGFGLFANEQIKAGEFVIEYVGEVIDDQECEQRMIKYRDRGETHFYMLELDKDTLIDARYRSNESRFINHSCDPNSMTQKWNVDGMLRIGIFARRNISRDEEITIDYNFSHFGEAVECKCGSSACTGKIGRKRSEIKIVKGVPVNTLSSSKTSKQQQEVHEIVPLEIQRPIQVTSLALLKSAQLDTAWLNLYGFKKRRLFFSHAKQAKKGKTGGSGEDDSMDALSKPVSATSSSSSSPLSEWSSAAEDDTASTTTATSETLAESLRDTANKKTVVKSDWYEHVKEGKHLPEMRALHSYICGGKSDWSMDLSDLGQRGMSRGVRGLKKTTKNTAPANQVARLNAKRLSLLEARTRLFADLIAFANGTSKWNSKIPSSSSAINPDRIFRFIEQTKNGKRVHNNDLNDLSDDTCNRCGLSGELICCDGCPAAFHLCCTNLVMIPPANVDWFCSNCTNPKHAKLIDDGDENAARRQLRTHAAPLVPSLKRFNSNSQQHKDLVKKKYKKRAKPVDRSYRMLEQMPLPAIADSEEE